jgi:dTDP-4-dehydrorhamnose reductase
LTVVADRFGSPTFTRDLAKAICDLVRRDAYGRSHFTDSASGSWFKVVLGIQRKAGRGSSGVLPFTTAQASRSAKRLFYSFLSPANLYAHGLKLRNWQQATGAYLEELREQGALV